MPKYNTVHDIFTYLYLFQRNPITQSPTLNVPNKLYGQIRLEELLSAKILYFRIKTTRSDQGGLLFSQVAINETWNKSDFSECIKRSRWKYRILVRRIGEVEFDQAELYTFDTSYIYLICIHVIPQCKLGREYQHEKDDISLLYFYQTISHFSRYNYIQCDCMIPRNNAFITENADLRSCFMPVFS